MEQPLVSIICEVFNHEPFLRQCLEGFVMQKTNFPVEILIHDDASTDRSADIIREYEQKYPDLFRPIYQTENQYSKKVNVWAEIQFPRAKGKYIAICEGDDYWTDPCKLQKQVDYLEAHPECSLCFHNAVIHTEGGKKEDMLFYQLEERDYTGEELCRNWISPTPSLVFRRPVCKEFSTVLARTGPLVFGDRPLTLCCAHQGTVHALPEAMCVYRRHDGGYTHVFNSSRIFGQATSWEKMRGAFDHAFYEPVTKTMMDSYILAFIRGLQEKAYPVALKAFYRGIIRHPWSGFSALLKIPSERKDRLSHGR